ncbi:BspA family leucine-rich repeat surface protein, partial [Chryseobacterium sp. CH1]|uniref:BspA family leucine-rich repeat surface protein n=1 Tax=Chryseobacterium sp. CH1 TaxID=713551 RepID=UPI00100BE242
TWLQQFDSGFANCPSLNVTATDTPDLTQISNLSQMFLNCSSLVGNNSFSYWNTHNITDMSTWLQQFDSGFANCPSLNVTATDTPDLTQISNLS